MIKMANRLYRRERKRLQKKTEEAKQRGGVSASLFLESEMNVLENADCFFFYGSRRFPEGLLTVFFPDETHAEITVAKFTKEDGMLPVLFQSALEECERVEVQQVHTVRNPALGFDLERIEGIRFRYDWSEYMLCNDMRTLAEKGDACAEVSLGKEETEDGSIRYVLFRNGEEAAACNILPTADGTQCYLFGLKTKETMRRKGMATRLLSEIAKEYMQIEGAVLRLQVSSQNEPAERLYRKLGFRTEEQREYYKTEVC